jgi:hypothetical protein
LERFSDKELGLPFLPATQAYADSSSLGLFEVGSPSEGSSSATDTEGLVEHCRGPVAAALRAAISTSESWLSIVAMNDPNAASVLALSFGKALMSLD